MLDVLNEKVRTKPGRLCARRPLMGRLPVVHNVPYPRDVTSFLITNSCVSYER